MTGGRAAIAIAVLVCAARAVAQPLPAERPTGPLAIAPGQVTITEPVTDLSGRFTEPERAMVARPLAKLREQTGIQMAALIVDSTAPLSIEAFAQGVFARWRGGSAERNDGVLFVLAIADRKNRLHLGDGIAQVISTADAQAILDGLRPKLRAELYSLAAIEAIEGVARLTSHIRPGQPLARRPVPFGAGTPLHVIAIGLLGCALGVLWHRERRRRARTPWYLTRWSVLVPIAVGAGAVVAIYTPTPGAGYAILWALALLFGIAASRVARTSWVGALILLGIVGIPVGIPVGVLGAVMVGNGTLGFADLAAAQATAVYVALVLLVLAAIGFLSTRMAAWKGDGRSYPDEPQVVHHHHHYHHHDSSSSSSSGGSDWSGGGGSSSGGGASSDW